MQRSTQSRLEACSIQPDVGLCAQFGLRPSAECYTIKDTPGCFLFKNLVNSWAQKYWIRRAVHSFCEPPNLRNFDRPPTTAPLQSTTAAEANTRPAEANRPSDDESNEEFQAERHLWAGFKRCEMDCAGNGGRPFGAGRHVFRQLSWATLGMYL